MTSQREVRKLWHPPNAGSHIHAYKQTHRDAEDAQTGSTAKQPEATTRTSSGQYPKYGGKELE